MKVLAALLSPRGMLGNVVSCFTWLRSCSKDLSSDLLTDPVFFCATLSRAAAHKEGVFYSEGNSPYNSKDHIFLFWKAGRLTHRHTDTWTVPDPCILPAGFQHTERWVQLEENQLKPDQPDSWNIHTWSQQRLWHQRQACSFLRFSFVPCTNIWTFETFENRTEHENDKVLSKHTSSAWVKTQESIVLAFSTSDILSHQRRESCGLSSLWTDTVWK